MTQPKLLIVDLFCGAGGTTTGFMNNKECMVIACVNHDANAIKSHAANHPECLHFTEDIRTLDLTILAALVAKYRALYPDAKLILWASLECTNFSKAKGGQPRDGDSRSLADHMEKYVIALSPDYFMIENVVEFMSWGPLDDKGKPVSKKQGSDYMRWCNEIDRLGYYNEWKELNAANFGAYTSRNRLFGIFAAHGMPIVWPEATHSKKASHSLFGASLQKWNAVKEKLDFSDEGYSIFHRSQNTNIPKRHRKDIGDNSLIRYYEGCIKHISGGRDRFEHHVRTYYPEMVETHCRPEKKNKKNKKEKSGSEPQPAFISKYYTGNPDSRNNSIEEPLGTIPTENRFALLQSSFLGTYHGNGHNTHDVWGAAPTLPCNDNLYIINTTFIDKYYSGSGNHSSVDSPLGTILQNDKNALMTVKVSKEKTEQGAFDFSFIDSTQYTNKPTSINTPLPTITADRHWPYILNPSHGGHTNSVDEACPTIIARQDKAPLYLVMVQEGKYAIRIFETDSKPVVMLKQFMAMFGIVDIKMRMLKVKELLSIQGFPAGYVLAGSQEEQKKHIGNSVEPNQVTCWALAIAEKLREQFKQAA